MDACSWLFFFFQAEDGIRDGHVTGVQTCALPISFLVANADIATDLALQRLIEAHHSARAAATVLAIPVVDEADFYLEQSWDLYLIDRREEARSGDSDEGQANVEHDVRSYVAGDESENDDQLDKALVRDYRDMIVTPSQQLPLQ